MTYRNPATPRRSLARCGVALLFVCAALFLAPLHAADSGKRNFDLPADTAERSLKRFAQQSGLEVVFVAEITDGVRANAVRGEFTPIEAAQRLVAGTALQIVRDERTGVLTVARAPQGPPANPAPEKNGASRQPAVSPTAAAGQPDAATAREEPLMLSEFRVDTTKDRGYLATNATTGTRLNMEIKNIPMPIEVITREFIDDIGAVDIKEALQYSSGIVQDTVQSSNNFTFSPSGTGQNTGALSRDSATLNIRGFNTRSFLRSGFRQDTVTDVVNVDRQEIARGPQSLLYGIAALGGIVNITPKYPRNAQHTAVRLGFGSDDFYRAEIYNTGPLRRGADGKPNLKYGVGVVFQNTSSRDDFDDRRRMLVTPAIEFRPFAGTNVFVDVEYGQFRNTGNGFKDVSDASAGQVRNELGLRVNENANVYNETAGVSRDRFRQGRFYRLSGGDTFTEDDYFSGTVEVTQKLLPGLTLVGSANYSDRATDRRVLDSQGVSTVNTASAAAAPTTIGAWTSVGANPVTPAQNLWKTISYQWAMPHTHKLIRQTRVDLNYELTIFGQKQSLLIGRQDQTVDQSEMSTAQVTSNVPGGTNRSFLAFTPGARVSYQGERTRIFRDTQFTEWNTGHYAIYQGRWWRDRITTIGGMRWDRYMVRDLQYDYAKADATQLDSNVANWVRPANFNVAAANSAPGAVPKVNGYRFGGNVQRQTSPTAGVSAALTEDISIYAVSATGIFPNTGQRNGAGEPFEAEKTKSKEAGLKFDLWKDSRGRSRVSASAAFFRIERDNAIYNLFWAPQPRSNNQATMRAGFTGNTQVTGTGAGAYAVTNSAYTSFQTSRPVTYLLPIGYVAAADLSSPRVAGAPQQAGFILVDYASLGAAATDPLRRALDAAAGDSTNLTALQTASVGTGAAAFNANNGYALNRNSDTSYSDRTEGFDAQIYFNLTDNYSAVLTYTYITQGVTGGFRVADQTAGTEYDSWWNYMGVPLDDRRGNKDESTFNFVGQIAGARTIDNPRNQLALWNKYEFSRGALKGLNLGVGVKFNGERQSQVAINNGARNLELSENVRFKPRYAADYMVNLGVGYRRRIADRSWNFRLNVNNILNEQKKVSFGTSTLFIDPATGGPVASTTVGAQKITVPERAVRYFEPISFRLVASTSF